jgi:tRNA pseudouridine38-40 synthase
VKTIWKTAIREELPLVEVRFAGSGFRYQMVRRMMGLLLAVSQGREKRGAVRSALENPEKGRVTYNAQPQGLVLERVMYSEDEIREAIRDMK